MAAFSVFLPGTMLRNRELSEAPILVGDSFAWGAFCFTPLWCLWWRSWLGFCLWALVAAMLIAAGHWSQISISGLLGIAILMSFAFALEANVLVHRALTKRGTRLVDYVIAPSREQAERLFFERWTKLQSRSLHRPAPLPRPASAEESHHGMGLFPNGRRTA